MELKTPKIYLILFLLMPFISACGDYSIVLPNSYQLVRITGYEVAIVDSTRHFVVEPNIDKYAVSGNFVIGHVSLPEHGRPTDSVPGYFILDTSNKSVKLGLTKEQWTELISKENIQEFKLINPSRFN